jgi:hypothetical protein
MIVRKRLAALTTKAAVNAFMVAFSAINTPNTKQLGIGII